MRRLLLLGCGLLALPAHADPVAGTPLPGEPQVIQRVTEDDQVRIEELRVRGQTRRLTVQPKIKGLGPYEITPPEPGRDPAQDPKAGQRIWFSLSF
ncbi:hypothetical protein KAK07_10475 [Ideonella sp. 4Y16]|uniref:DUF2782 domain-containing protein n=1 Tax=Ideonella alba TaxID=2824118 RepID=A0A941BHC1_9BURK|nr:hypothetical protein [Ideonella alba]MBQ0931458.1 hypothetical protein [Ideonella alba]MBQ0943763.1 hypothetical protein [Ideonella alba]